eukprot:Seg250.4 transcript_id=Seg250.4/GoldUCD/mRNA.D3Y31 product="hypothetical protein" protein_id=Seg250.4/GoldUCD/D3Y31
MNETIAVITAGLAGNSNFASNGRSAAISTVNTNERLTNIHLVSGTLASSYTMNATITINTTGLAGNSNFAANRRSTMISTIDRNEILTNMQFACWSKFKGRNTAMRQKTTANMINLYYANISSCHAGLLQGCNVTVTVKI